ncbi:hypothetical protein SAY86_003577 [Trapa natans]|uniref:Uncharacterized protein n=1 Tax=Trapa natans TaxID=22666 RepID=A0AAN7MD18_TRANT|nr:hypothetical protein SAY86_003577 [Trapa natans]
MKFFAVTAVELFLSLASLLIKRRNRNSSPSSDDSLLIHDGGINGGGNGKAILEEEIDPDVIWEQRVITSPGFSFSAAGLLFPYSLGVAQLLIERGYIKETTPLAGSSAGPIVCAVVASGKSMAEGLRAFKILAEDCRSRGTAFRLGTDGSFVKHVILLTKN